MDIEKTGIYSVVWRGRKIILYVVIIYIDTTIMIVVSKFSLYVTYVCTITYNTRVWRHTQFTWN